MDQCGLMCTTIQLCLQKEKRLLSLHYLSSFVKFLLKIETGRTDWKLVISHGLEKMTGWNL